MLTVECGELEKMMRRFNDWLTRPKLVFFFGGSILAQLILFLWLESTSGILDRQGRVRGRDFLQFYLAGRILSKGEADRLYDQEYFLGMQKNLIEFNEKCPPYLSLYPPTVALLFSPLGGLPFPSAVPIWWSIQGACFLVAGFILFRVLDPCPGWRHIAWLGLMSFYPVINTFWNGQLAALLLLVFVVGLELRRRGRSTLAGLTLSLLAMKPQLATGIAAWLLLSRDWRASAGFHLGLLSQAGLITVILTPQVCSAFVNNTRVYAQLFSIQQFTADHQHALAGILVDLFGAGYRKWAILGQFLMAIYAGIILVKIHRRASLDKGIVEASAGVLFVLLATPHLLTYDLSYLLIPITYVLSLPGVENDPDILTPPVLLYLSATLSPLYVYLGFSVLPLVLLWMLHALVGICPGAIPSALDQKIVVYGDEYV